MKLGTRPQKINRIARKLADRCERQRNGQHRPLVKRGRRPRFSQLIAYDLETTRIKEGTPEPRYITAFCDSWSLSMKIKDLANLAEILEVHFLTDDFEGARFVAWNGNNFDVFLVAAALLHTDRYILRPYLTRSKGLRGLRVISKENEKISWEFLDGISMTGLTGKKLSEFLKVFCPDYGKLKAPDWETEEFDVSNSEHVKYAERDSEGLYRGIMQAQQIIVNNFGLPLQPTIGNLGIKIFQMCMPIETVIWAPPLAVTKIIRGQVMRGGYCYRFRQFDGPVWKYDINQAYAAAMREAKLPAGRCIHTKVFHPHAQAGIYRIRARNFRNIVPFYYRDMKGKACDGIKEINETWITCIELRQLIFEGWGIEILEGYFWDEVFSMRDYVNQLEKLRMDAKDGPNGAEGTMIKMIGNNSYGKTVEQLDGLELIMANEKPEGWHNYNSLDDSEQLQHVFFKFGKPLLRDYHQPQIGAFITAHVRMVVRRAINLCPKGWLYADTDCVIFDRAVKLDVDPKKYGFWKIEASGERFKIIAKKVYANADATIKHAKGLNIRRLSEKDFSDWLSGKPPMQTQIQRNNFVKVMSGAPMFGMRTKIGQRISTIVT